MTSDGFPAVRQVRAARVDADALRSQISDKYTEVALTPDKGFHFHTGRPLASMLGYDAAVVDALPPGVVESFAGTGNPFSWGDLRPGGRFQIADIVVHGEVPQDAEDDIDPWSG